MANIEHAAIADPYIHEPKGIAAASADQVYLSDGAGSGDWTDIETLVETYTPEVPESTDKFSSALIHVRGENTTETISSSASSWTTRTLNTTKTNEVSGSLSSNRISLPSGTYFIEATTVGNVEIPDSSSGGLFKSKLYNVTGSADLVIGTIQGWDMTITDETLTTALSSTIRGRFTLASTSNVEIRCICTDLAATCVSSPVTTSSNIASSVNVATDVCIWKIS